MSNRMFFGILWIILLGFALAMLAVNVFAYSRSWGQTKPETQAEIWGWQAASAPPGTLWRIPDPKAEWVFVPAPHDDAGNDWLMKPSAAWTPADVKADRNGLVVSVYRDGDTEMVPAYPIPDTKPNRALMFVWDNCGKLLVAAVAFLALIGFLGILGGETDCTRVRHCLKCGYVGHEKLCPSLACEDALTVCPGFTSDRPFVGGMYQGANNAAHL